MYNVHASDRKLYRIFLFVVFFVAPENDGAYVYGFIKTKKKKKQIQVNDVEQTLRQMGLFIHTKKQASAICLYKGQL